jgi:hypothetical protein
LSFEPSDDNDGFGILANFIYNEKRVRELAAHMIFVHEYPFNMMEHEFFREKFSLPSEISGVFQFEPQSFKIGSLPP